MRRSGILAWGHRMMFGYVVLFSVVLGSINICVLLIFALINMTWMIFLIKRLKR